MESKKLINFLEPIFKATKIQCSSIMDDIYSVENLISSDQQKNRLGFMAYRVVKPPIDLEFCLEYSIELVTIKIWSQIDSLKSTGFEVYAKSEKQIEYRKIGSYFNLKENGIQFSNNCNAEHESNFAVTQFYPSTKNQLRNVKNIKLCIKQTNRGCVPVIKRIEIWGHISKFETEERRMNIQQIIFENQQKTTAQSSSTVNQIENNVNASQDERNNHFDIPEEFLDELTYEIMALPMILPSGKVIDNSTLMRHNEQEEKWGRIASDPFTGQIYTNTRKPILDVRLKSQIDAFLLRNSCNPNTSAIPRTVGSVGKRKIYETNETNEREAKLLKPRINSIQNQHSATCSEIGNKSQENLSTSNHIKNHCSYISAIHDILKTSKYTAATTTTQYKNLLEKCFQCPNSNQSSINSLYTIKLCAHLICRNCLIDKNVSTCKCGQEFSNFDVNKYHLLAKF